MKVIFRKGFSIGLVWILIAMIFTAVPTNVSAQSSYFAGGSGTPEDPYQISNANELENIGLFWNLHYILINDIDASGTYYWHGGKGFDPIDSFSGTFEGNGYEITGLFMNRQSTTNAGLFGSTTSGGEIKNVSLKNARINAYRFVGSLVGYNEGGTISNCNITGSVSATFSCVGGLVGLNDGGTISNCYSEIIVAASNFPGGLVGLNDGGTISNCYSTGEVRGGSIVGGLIASNDGGTILNSYSTCDISGYNDVGGLIGRNMLGSATISNCYSTGKVFGNEHVGGFAGYNQQGSISQCYSTGDLWGINLIGGFLGYGYQGSVSNCYSTGVVIGNYKIGGLVGRSYQGSISNCYSTGSVSGIGEVGGLIGSQLDCSISYSFWDTETSGQSSSVGGTGKTTSEMKTKSTFTDAGWDFVDIWNIFDDFDYPFLRWEAIPWVPDAGSDITTHRYDDFQLSGSVYLKGSETYPVWPVDISGNGDYLAAGWDKNVSFFSTASNTPIWIYNTEGQVGDLKLSDDGQYLAVGSHTKMLFFTTSSSSPLWSVDTGKRFDGDPGNQLDMTHDAKYIAVAASGNRVKIFDTTSPTPAVPYWDYYFGDEVNTVSFSGDGNYLSMGGTHTHMFKLGSIPAKSISWTHYSGDPYYSSSLSYDGSKISAGQGISNRVRLFSSGSPSPLWTSTLKGRQFEQVMSDDGKYLISGNHDDSRSGSWSGFAFWDTSSSTPVWTYTSGIGHRTTNADAVDMDRNGNYVVGGTRNNDIYLFDQNRDGLSGWNTADGMPVFTYSTGGSIGYNGISMSSDGSYFAAGSSDGHVYLFSNDDEPQLVWRWRAAYPNLDQSSFTFRWDMDDSRDRNNDGNYTNDFDNYGQNPIDYYNQPEIYNATLTVIDEDGRIKIDTVKITVIDKPNIVYVDDDFHSTTPGWGYDHFNLIQDGINAVARYSGTVNVYSGTYRERFDFRGKAINLLGENKDTTIIEGSNKEDTVTINSNGATMTGFTITNTYTDWAGAAIKLLGARNCEVYGISITAIFYNEFGFDLLNSNDNHLFNNTILKRNYVAFNLKYSHRNLIEGNTGTQFADGIILTESNSNLIRNNRFNSDVGVAVWGNSALGNEITENNFANNVYGFYFMYCDNNLIINNNLSYGWYGIEMGYSDGNIISGNIIVSNIREGISFYSSNNNIIERNNCSFNEYGIYIGGYSSSENNMIYHNNFIGNTINAYSKHANNFWDDGYPSGGNYWSDYSGNDDFSGPAQDQSGYDGIGDTAYTNIQGSSGAVDNYPLTVPWESWARVYDVEKDMWYHSIQIAIDYADPGNTIEVKSGIYNENLVIDKTLNLIGDDKETTIIDGGGSGNVVTISANDVELSGFTLRNSGTGLKEAGIELNEAQDCKINNNNLKENDYGLRVIESYGINVSGNTISDNEFCGIHSYQSTILIDDNEIIDNGDRTEVGTAGIIMIDCGTTAEPVIISNSDVSNSYYGVYFKNSYVGLQYTNLYNCEWLIFTDPDPVYLSVENSVLSDSTYGIYLDNTPAFISGNEFNQNTYGIFCLSSDATIDGNIFTENDFGIYLENSNPVINNNNFNENGYAVYYTDSSYPVIANNEFQNNDFDSNLVSKDLKDDLITDLTASKTGDKKIDSKIDEVIEHIEDSLDNKLWQDDEHIKSKHGHKIFNSEKQALKKLIELMDHKNVPDELQDTFTGLLNGIVNSDRLLAKTSLEEARIHFGTNKKIEMELARAELNFQEAGDHFLAGDYGAAVDHYKKAWEHSQNVSGLT